MRPQHVLVGRVARREQGVLPYESRQATLVAANEEDADRGLMQPQVRQRRCRQSVRTVAPNVLGPVRHRVGLPFHESS